MSGVSVVMGTYNGEDYVKEQLESILGQTTAPLEIIVSDDASTDGTCGVVTSVAAGSAVPIHLFRNEQRLGFSENFLRACDHASGRYIAFSDQDDRWAPAKLERGVAALADHDAVLSSHLVGKIDARGNEIATPPAALHRPWVVRPQNADPWGNFLGFTMLFERTLLGHLPYSVRGLDPHSQDAVLSHDRWLWFLASTFGTMVQLPERLADYRQHDKQLYGGLRPRTYRQRITTKLADGERHTRHLARVAGQRAELLERAQLGETVRPAATRWRALQSNLERSAAIHAPSRRTRLLSRFGGNLRAQVYDSADGGLGRERLLQDLTIVIVRLLPASVTRRG